MNIASNIKDKVSTICGVLAAIGGGILVVGQSGVVLPSWLTAAAGTTVAVCTAIIGYLTGKAPNATVKTTSQVVDQNTKNP